MRIIVYCCLLLIHLVCNPISVFSVSRTPRTVTIRLEHMLDAFTREEPYEVEGLGVFTASVRRPYTFTHWKSGTKVHVPARALVTFTADVEIKEELQIKLRKLIESRSEAGTGRLQ